MNQNLPRIMLAAMHSGAGKTTITCGLLAAFRKRGIRLRSFKCGPDYIDPMFHREVLGIPSGNLDSFFTPPERLRQILAREEADLTVLEGVMGYYDGLGGISSEASSYEIACMTKTPVILIADARGVSVSLCAEIQGMQRFGDGEGSRIAGVILNRVSPMFYGRLKALVEEKCGLPVLGYLPEDSSLVLPSRHLGLVKPEELPDFAAWTARLAAAVEKYIDLKQILTIAAEAERLFTAEKSNVLPKKSTETGDQQNKALPFDHSAYNHHEGSSPMNKTMKPIRILVAEDAAFQFEYAENRSLLERLGAVLVPFSPLKDTALPKDADGLILSGGYPENFAAELSENAGMRQSIADAVRKGLPTIAECGGFLYLSTALDGQEMCGIFPGHAEKQQRLTRFGYIEARFPFGGLFGPAGTTLRGHEFHYYDTEANGTDAEITKPKSDRHYRAGFYSETIYAGFPHFYLESNPTAAEAFTAACRRYQTQCEAQIHWDQIAKPIDSLGKLETMVSRLCALQGNVGAPDITKRALLIFAADHGVVAEGVSQTDASVTRIVAENLAGGTGVTSRLAKRAGADVYVLNAGMLEHDEKALDTKTESADSHADSLRRRTDDTKARNGGATVHWSELHSGEIFNACIRNGSRNLAREAAMTLEETAAAIQLGRQAVRQLTGRGYRIFGTGEMGIGNTTAATAVFLGLFLQNVIPSEWIHRLDDQNSESKHSYGGAAEASAEGEATNRCTAAPVTFDEQLHCLLQHYVGRGAGLSDAGLEKKRAAIEKGLLRVSARGLQTPSEILAELGGYEIAALTGAFLAAGEQQIPILIDGAISACAALVACCIDRRTRTVLFPSHLPKETVGSAILRILELSPILDGNFALGEGSGTMLLLPLLDMAEDIYREMGSFADIHVSQYERFD